MKYKFLKLLLLVSKTKSQKIQIVEQGTHVYVHCKTVKNYETGCTLGFENIL